MTWVHSAFLINFMFGLAQIKCVYITQPSNPNPPTPNPTLQEWSKSRQVNLFSRLTKQICLLTPICIEDQSTAKFSCPLLPRTRLAGSINSSVFADLFTQWKHQNWPRDRKFTQSCWCLHWSIGLRADVWKILLQVHTRLVVTQVYIEKMFNNSLEWYRVSECSFSPLSASVRAIIVKW